ncbi:MAG TPA: diaminopimelate decarboxylase [Thermoleophilaceae bacterium]|jgi:diaminopimelate decarboxylase
MLTEVGWGVFPAASRLGESGALEVGGCDVVELAREFGTPAYVFAEDDLRGRARAFVEAFRSRTDRFGVVYASKAFPCAAACRIMAEEGLSCDVASGGELHLALRAGFPPERIYMHGNNKTDAELRYAVEQRVGTIVADSLDDVDRIAALAPGQRVLLRVTPGIAGMTHSAMSTGQEDSKFGIPPASLPEALERAARLEVAGLHAHIGSQIVDLDPFEQIAATLAELGDYPVLSVGGGLGIAYRYDDRVPTVDDWVDALLRGAPEGVEILAEPGRALVGNAGVTIYSVGTVKEIPGVRTYVAVDGGMSDNMRPMLYGSRYEAEIADRFGGETLCSVAGMHCESGDVLVRDVLLDDPRRGDVLVIPATGAYGYALANNYNQIPRPPVIFCRDGAARVVVRRETYDDLARRDCDD